MTTEAEWFLWTARAKGGEQQRSLTCALAVARAAGRQPAKSIERLARLSPNTEDMTKNRSKLDE